VLGVRHAPGNQFAALGAMPKRIRWPKHWRPLGQLPSSRLESCIGFANIVQKDQHSQSLQICLVERSASRKLHGSSDTSTFNQSQKARGDIGHVVKQWVLASQLSRFASR
jgi:hypothetical protein